MNGPIIRYTKAADGVDISYGEFPDAGTPIVVVPKFGQLNVAGVHKLHSLVDFYNALRGGAPTFLFDFRGNGLSGGLRGDPSVEQYKLDLAAVMDVAGQTVDLVAYHGGCHAAARFAVEHPERVRSLTMVCPLPNALLDIRFYGRVLNDDYEMGSILALRFAFDIAPDEPINDLVAEFQRSYSKSTIKLLSDPRINFSVSIAEDLRRVQAPVLVIGPEDDSQWPEARETAALLPGVTHWKTPVIPYNAALGQRIRSRMDASLGHMLSAPSPARNGSGLSGLSVRELKVPRGTRSRPSWPAFTGDDECRRIGGAAAGTLDLGGLSDRECEVVSLIAAGKTNAEIAEALTITTATASKHVHNILGKLGMSRRSEAAAWWARTCGPSN
jgi:DNA-binding CsgD family transcriptional regulator/pimeloyl-ACP methyl ester carboxylesterase